MFIIDYKYSDGIKNGWSMCPVTFSKMNLCVGLSGEGKTKLLNTIYNLFLTTMAPEQINDNAHWTLTFKLFDSTDIFLWDLHVKNKQIEYEELKQNDKIIIKRDSESFFYNDNKLPQLDRSQSALKLLSSEIIILRIINDIKKVIRRNFFDGELEMQSSLANFDEDSIINDPNFDIKNGLSSSNYSLPMVVRLFVLSKTDYKKWLEIEKAFLLLFPNFSKILFSHVNNQKQIFVIENGEKIILNELSSGVKKALLIISDILTLKKGSIYLIDEIENSLGSNILDNLVEFIDDNIEDIQFIITSHHPYIINHIPYSNWKIVKRKGKMVTVTSGKDLDENFKLSKHDAFIKLQNMV